MIQVTPAQEPDDFDRRVRQPGARWLETPEHREADRPANHWRACIPELRAQFSGRCGYLAMSITGGETDHFVSWKRCQRLGRQELAYEWRNLRWAFPQINQAKGAWLEPLDPFEVEDGWFELDLPSLELMSTDRIPLELREKALRTVSKLGLQDGYHAMTQRQAWLERYREGTPLRVLDKDAPLLGRALRRLIEAPEETLRGPQRRFRRDLHRARALAAR